MRWLTATIGSICRPTGARDPRETPDESFLYVDISSIDREQKTITQTAEIPGADSPSRARKEIRAGDILVSTVRPNLNAVAMVPPELDGQIASTGFCVLRPDRSQVEGRYLFYFVRTKSFIETLSAVVRGAHYPAVSDRDVMSVEIPLPPLSEQHRIVEILDQTDALRKKRAEADAKAARLATALFRRYFGGPMGYSKLWERRPLKEAVCVLGGSTPSKSKPEFWEGNIPWVSPKDMKDVILSDTADHITKEAIKNSAANLLPKEAVLLVVRSGILAHSVPIAITQTMVAINQDIKAFISNPSDFNPWYLLAFMISAKELLLGCVKRGVTVHSIDMSKLRNLSIIKPPLSLQEQFGKIFRDLLQGQQQRRIRAERVDHLFNVLLQKAFSGALTVKWREAYMKEVLEEMEHQARALGQ